MNKRIKAKWLEALRSGRYKQGRDKLKNGDKFCCLGVLCDLHRLENNKTRKLKLGWGEGETYLDEDAILPDAVMEWAGLETKNPIVEDYDLATFNDGYKGCKVRPHTFKQIAKLIEKHL